jgi:hypothetical protein
MKTTFLALSMFFTSLAYGGDFKTMAPTAIGNLLERQGLQMRSYRLPEGDVQFSASTPYKDVDAGTPLPNNLAYYISGEEKKVTQLKLALNLNDPTLKEDALSALVTAASALLKAASDDAPIVEVADAIRKSAPGKWSVKNGTIQLSRIDWPTGRGYELQLTIK